MPNEPVRNTYKLKSCEMVSDNPMDYIRVALALETLAYHNKNYLSKRFTDNCELSREIQSLLIEALKEGANNG